MKKSLLFLVCLCVCTLSASAQLEPFTVVKGKVGVRENDGVMLNSVKLTRQDAASLKQLLTENPSAGFIQVVEADGSVKSYGKLNSASVRFGGKSVNTSAINIGRSGPQMSDYVIVLVINKNREQSSQMTAAFKARQLLRRYQ